MKNTDLTKDSVWKTLLPYSLPLIIMNLVQLMFNAVDVVILGIMVSDASVAAVGACGSLTALFVNFFSAFSTGSGILVANCVGAKDEKGAQHATGVSLVIGFLSGLLLMGIALIGARQMLIWINCPEDILDSAVLYLRVYFAGMPVLMLYTVAGGILRAVGDSTKPMIYMLVAGVLKIGLNVLLIGVFDLTVEGVALSTLLSNAAALTLAGIALFRGGSYCRVKIGNLRLRKAEFLKIMKIGVPAGLGGLCFYIGNIFISAQTNALNQSAITAHSISGQLDGIVYNVGLSIATACMSMVGQAMGAKDARRISRILRTGSVYATVASLSLGVILIAFAEPLLDIMTDSREIIALAKPKLVLLCLTYFITSIMEVYYFSLNAMQRSQTTAVVCLFCGLGIRTAWSLLIVPLSPSLVTVQLAVPVSALVATVIYMVIYARSKDHMFAAPGGNESG